MADELKNTTTGASTASAGTQKRAPRNDVNGVPRTERLRRPADPNELLTHNQPPRRAIQNRPADPERMGVPLQAVKKEDASSHTGGLAAEEAAAAAQQLEGVAQAEACAGAAAHGEAADKGVLYLGGQAEGLPGIVQNFVTYKGGVFLAGCFCIVLHNCWKYYCIGYTMRSII